MKTKAALVIVSVLILSSPCLAVKKREIILGFGGGYSLGLDGSLRKHEFDETYVDPLEWCEYKLLYFKENSEMKQYLNFNIQYFFNIRYGIQLEFNRQKASYFSHLKWYGSMSPDGVPDPQNPASDNYTEINHIEEPYQKPWSLSSLTLSFIFNIKKFASQRTYPFVSAGAGLYLLSGDKDLVLNRFRLGPKSFGLKMKFSGGFKHQLNSKLGLNLRIFLESIQRYRLGRELGLYYGPDQFDFEWYLLEGKIGRVMAAIVRSYTYGGIDLSVEYKLK